MRLIDADALKKAFYNQECWSVVIGSIIDNAPTVETKECPYSCEKCAKKMICELGKEMERPQGEWIDHSETDGYVECPFCGSATTCEDNKDELRYCWNCGAELKVKTPCNNCIDDSDCDNCGAKMKGGAE